MEKLPRVLIVEDHQIVVLALEDLIQDLGCEVVGSVGSGEEAIAAAQEQHPDLVIMDIDLKGQVGGIEAAIDLKQRLGIPSIFFSGYSDAETRHKAERAEPLGFLDKTAPLAEVAALIQHSVHA